MLSLFVELRTENINRIFLIKQCVNIYIHRELNTLGSRAFSHESVFIPEDSEKTYPGQTMSQENVSDKVRNIQVRLFTQTV